MQKSQGLLSLEITLFFICSLSRWKSMLKLRSDFWAKDKYSVRQAWCKDKAKGMAAKPLLRLQSDLRVEPHRPFQTHIISVIINIILIMMYRIHLGKNST